MPTIKYWKYKESVEAKVTRNKDGALIMKMVGEDYEFPGFPRGYLLFGKLSKLKHEIKNRIFNYAWEKLEEKKEAEIKEEIHGRLEEIYELAEDTKYDRIPYERMYKPVKEIYRAWTAARCNPKLRDIVTFILQEDDSYRFRVQFLAEYLTKRENSLEQLERGLDKLEQAEVIGDMKDRIRLLKRILMFYVKHIRRESFERFFKEVDWKKVRLTEADKYHFRGKYFKVDLELFDY